MVRTGMCRGQCQHQSAWLRSRKVFGYGSEYNQRTAGFSIGFRLPGFHFGYSFLTRSHLSKKLQEVQQSVAVFLLRGFRSDRPSWMRR